jgi:hypothetical protein
MFSIEGFGFSMAPPDAMPKILHGLTNSVLSIIHDDESAKAMSYEFSIFGTRT